MKQNCAGMQQMFQTFHGNADKEVLKKDKGDIQVGMTALQSFRV